MAYPLTPKTNVAETARRIDEIAASASAFFGKPASLEEELKVAQAMGELRAALTKDVMQPIMDLMNTNIGFKTDRDPNRPVKGQTPTPYGWEVVRECFMESRLRGFHTVGNEWNIISGQFYAAKNGLDRKVKNFPGLTDFRMFFNVPDMKPSGATVKCKASWVRDGVADSLDADIPVRVNEYMGADAVLGKATRKLLARVHDRLTGTNTPEAEIGEEPAMLAPQMPSTPHFTAPPPQDTPPTEKTPPSPVSEPAKATPAPPNAQKKRAVDALAVKMAETNVDVGQVITFLIQKGDAHQDSLTLEEVPVSKLLGLLSTFDNVKDQIAAIEV